MYYPLGKIVPLEPQNNYVTIKFSNFRREKFEASVLKPRLKLKSIFSSKMYNSTSESQKCVKEYILCFQGKEGGQNKVRIIFYHVINMLLRYRKFHVKYAFLYKLCFSLCDSIE